MIISIIYLVISFLLEGILEYRNLYKLMSGYTDKLKSYILEDGKIHTIYKQAITRTGRLSSVLPNLQNIPIRSEEGRIIRKAFVPEEGCVLLDADYSQIELRLMAHISKDENMINAFNTGEDIHTKVASDVFDVPINEVTKEQRRTAKAVIFGIVYGNCGAYMIRCSVVMSVRTLICLHSGRNHCAHVILCIIM